MKQNICFSGWSQDLNYLYQLVLKVLRHVLPGKCVTKCTVKPEGWGWGVLLHVDLPLILYCLIYSHWSYCTLGSSPDLEAVTTIIRERKGREQS